VYEWEKIINSSKNSKFTKSSTAPRNSAFDVHEPLRSDKERHLYVITMWRAFHRPYHYVNKYAERKGRAAPLNNGMNGRSEKRQRDLLTFTLQNTFRDRPASPLIRLWIYATNAIYGGSFREERKRAQRRIRREARVGWQCEAWDSRFECGLLTAVTSLQIAAVCRKPRCKWNLQIAINPTAMCLLIVISNVGTAPARPHEATQRDLQCNVALCKHRGNGESNN